MSRRPRIRLPGVLMIALGAALISACVVEREPRGADGLHPEGWDEPKSTAFHGRWIEKYGTKALDECQACHGFDYSGGPVGVTCNKAGCHTKGPEFCGTCHGGEKGPRPMSGAHFKHEAYCAECHKVPATARASGHLNESVEVTFSGAALANGANPAWSSEVMTCSGTYCHLDGSPDWKESTGDTPCNICHRDPPVSHVRFSSVAGKGKCTDCHPEPPNPDAQLTHINGKLNVRPEVNCTTCHGHAPMGAPAPALDGSTDPASRGVGAHARHLDGTLSDRIGRVVQCSVCHPVPVSIDAPGHLDESVPADVTLSDGGEFNSVSQTCVVGCHWNRSPGPQWTDTTGAERACDACHGFPPEKTRKGTAHTLCSPDLGACLGCHTFDPSTHVDNHVDFKP